jgi:putative NADH-flavin reductase
MGKIVVFGAGGRAGRRVVEEAAARGHTVTAVSRTPGDRFADRRITVAAGDVTDPASVAAAATGHDAAITAAVRLDVPAVDFFTAATRALVTGLTEAGVPRLVLVGIALALEVQPGRRMLDDPAFPADHRAFALGHVAQLDVLADAPIDWVVLAPPPVFLDETAARTGRYRTGGQGLLEPPPESFSYADLAVALVDEAESPRHHRTMVAVGP